MRWRSRDVVKPRAVLCISARWYLSGSALTVNTAPRTIHEFDGFPPELYQVRYPAPGDPGLARRLQHRLSPTPAELDQSWAWTTAVGPQMFPARARPGEPVGFPVEGVDGGSISMLAIRVG